MAASSPTTSGGSRPRWARSCAGWMVAGRSTTTTSRASSTRRSPRSTSASATCYARWQMGLEDVRRRLPVVKSLPRSRGRKHLVREVKPGDVPTPALAVWEFTLACDQKCLHCGPRAGSPRADELDTDEALALVDEMAEAGVGEVVLIGGEAYLRNDFILVIRRIRERGMTATMTTGGYNITQARAE